MKNDWQTFNNFELVEPSVSSMEYLGNSDSVFSQFKKVESIARVCYKSKNNMDDNSSTFNLLTMLLKHKHYAMFEHAIFYFKVYWKNLLFYEDLNRLDALGINYIMDKEVMYITCNFRALLENAKKSILVEALKTSVIENFLGEVSPIDPFILNPFITELDKTLISGRRYNLYVKLVTPSSNEFKNKLFIKYFSFKILTDRGVSHELVRHRIASYAQESTRYCRYETGKIKFIRPSTWEEFDENSKECFLSSLSHSASFYVKMLTNGLTPQQARAVLPNSLVTTIVITASAEEFKHILNLRYYGTTGSPHPDMKKVMELLKPLLP